MRLDSRSTASQVCNVGRLSRLRLLASWSYASCRLCVLLSLSSCRPQQLRQLSNIQSNATRLFEGQHLSNVCWGFRLSCVDVPQ